MTPAEKQQLLKTLEAQARAKTGAKIKSVKPYALQRDFLAAGSTKRERLFMAGNRCGKTFCGALEMTYHLTGLYPDWWEGRRFGRPISAWAASDTGETTRNILQSTLCGPYDDKSKWGTGTIPRDCVDWDKDVSLARGVTDLFDTISVKHFTNGVYDGQSSLQLKTFDQGRKKWQGTAKDVIHLDEEPPLDVYAEALARIAPTNAGAQSGLIYVTATPLEGMSDVVLRFLNEESPDRAVVTMTIDDAEHISPEERAKIVAGYLPHEREARARGIPSLGAGRVFQFPEDDITCYPFEIPAHYALLWGIDFGLNHPFAAVLLAWDRESDVVYVAHAIRMSDALPINHAAAMKPVLKGFGKQIPVAWPQDGTQRREFEGDLVPTAKVYKAHGLRMLDSHAKFVDGSNSTEAGLLMMQERFASSRMKVFSNLSQWFEEYRQYHRDQEGRLVKVRDDLMSATRVGIMQLRSGKSVLFDPNSPNGGRGNPNGNGGRFANGPINRDPFGF
jgi:phage terminase large subunit-like protein